MTTITTAFCWISCCLAGSGLDLLRELKRLHRSDSVLIISAKDSLDDKVDGLELGVRRLPYKAFPSGRTRMHVSSH